jgi:predicted HD phosphohydrolase
MTLIVNATLLGDVGHAQHHTGHTFCMAGKHDSHVVESHDAGESVYLPLPARGA